MGLSSRNYLFCHTYLSLWRRPWVHSYGHHNKLISQLKDLEGQIIIFKEIFKSKDFVMYSLINIGHVLILRISTHQYWSPWTDVIQLHRNCVFYFIINFKAYRYTVYVKGTQYVYTNLPFAINRLTISSERKSLLGN